MNAKSLVLASFVLSTSLNATTQETVNRAKKKATRLIQCTSNSLESLSSAKILGAAAMVAAGGLFNEGCSSTYRRYTSTRTFRTPLTTMIQNTLTDTTQMNIPTLLTACTLIALKGLNKFARYLLNVKTTRAKSDTSEKLV